MSGNVQFKVRPGISKDPRYKSYAVWYWHIVGENGLETNVCPTYNEVLELVINAVEHEWKNDLIRKNRIPDFNIKINKFKEGLDALLQRDIANFDITNFDRGYIVYNQLKNPFYKYRLNQQDREVIRDIVKEEGS